MDVRQNILWLFSIHSEFMNCLGLSTVLSCMKSKLRWKASLLERRQREATTLSEEDVEFLVINTRFGVEDIREWYRQFILECPQVCKYNDSAAIQIDFQCISNIYNDIGPRIYIGLLISSNCFRVGWKRTKLKKCWRVSFLVKLLIRFRI